MPRGGPIATEFNVDLKGDKQLAEQIRGLGPDVKHRVARVTYSIALDIENDAKRGAPTGATSQVRNNIRVVQSRDKLSATVGIHQGDEGFYGRWVEEGRDPGKAPPFGQGSALRLWAKRKLGDEGAAFPVAMNIAEEGVDPQPFLEPAFDKHSPDYVPSVKKAISDLP